MEVRMSDAEGYEAWTIAEMKEELRSRELPVSGSKAELIIRLEEDDPEVEEEGEEVEKVEQDPVATALNRVASVFESLRDMLTPFSSVAEDIAQHMQEDANSPTEMFPTTHAGHASTPAPEPDETDTLRAHVKDATKRLLTAQPDGRKRAKSVLAEFGGSVSKVDADDLGACLQALQNHLDEIGV